MEKEELVELYDKTTINKENDKIPLKLVCDSMGIDYEYQARELGNHPILSKYLEKVSNESIFGDNRKRLSLTKKGFLIFILGLSQSSVQETKRSDFLAYQEFIFDYLYDDAMLREQLLKNKITTTSELNELEKEIQEDEKFKRYTHLKDKLKQTDNELKKLNNSLVKKIQGTLSFLPDQNVN